MKEFIISVENACDLDENTIDKYGIQVAPMDYIINGVNMSSTDKDFDAKKIAQFMREGATTKTTQINEYDAQNYLENLLKGGKDVLHISFSSAMSNTYNNFKTASETLNANHENKVVVVDSLCQSGGVGLLVKTLIDQMEKGKIADVNSARDYVESVKLNIAHVFTVENLKYLARGGRIKSSMVFIGNLVQLKPILKVNDAGVIVSYKKAIGRRRAIKEIADIVAKTYTPITHHIIIAHADCEDESNALKEMIETKLDVDVVVVPLSPIVTAHGGPGVVSVYYTTEKR